MNRKLGSEMKTLIFWATSITVLLLLLVIAYFMIDITITTANNIDANKQLMIDQSVETMRENGEKISAMGSDPTMFSYFNQDMVNKILGGDWSAIYELMNNLAMKFYVAEYVGVVRDGKLVTYNMVDGYELDPNTLPTQPPEGSYTTMDKLGDKQGFFISYFYGLNLKLLGPSEVSVNFIVDRTAQLKTVEETFTKQRNDLLLRLSIAALLSIVLFILLTTLGLRYLVNRFIMRPVNDLNDAAEEIVAGTFEGEVEYDANSSFAPIQGLLRSGQTILNKMDEELSE
jgi:methyl-accepting chemotaxis protein